MTVVMTTVISRRGRMKRHRRDIWGLKDAKSHRWLTSVTNCGVRLIYIHINPLVLITLQFLQSSSPMKTKAKINQQKPLTTVVLILQSQRKLTNVKTYFYREQYSYILRLYRYNRDITNKTDVLTCTSALLCLMASSVSLMSCSSVYFSLTHKYMCTRWCTKSYKWSECDTRTRGRLCTLQHVSTTDTSVTNWYVTATKTHHPLPKQTVE